MKPLSLLTMVDDNLAGAAPLKVAVVHYWLVAMRGGERVLERVLRMFPEADLYTHVYDPAVVSETIRSHKIITTFIDKLPFSKRLYKSYLPLMPMALESLDLSGYDLVISFEAGPAKGVVTSPDALHVCYCHSPMRYLWDSYPEYRARAGRLTGPLMSATFPFLRVWDQATAARVDGFMANSSFIARRIEKVYRRSSVVVPPPVPVTDFEPGTVVGEEFLWVGQMTPYKRGDLAVEAFNANGLPLLMIGDGEEASSLRANAKSNIRFRSKLSFRDLRAAYSRCQALIFTAEEDFGIIPVEAIAAGRPVIAFGRGGVLDTVRPGVTGLFFSEQSAESLNGALKAFSDWVPTFQPDVGRADVSRFSAASFDHAFLDAVDGYAGSRPAIGARIAFARQALLSQAAAELAS